MTENTNAGNIDYSFVKGGLLYRLLTKAGLAQPGVASVRMRAGSVLLLTYVPIFVLSLFQGVAWGSAVKVPFLFDIAETCRFLLVGPLLIWSEALVDPWIVEVVRHVRDRLISKEELPHYDKLISCAVRCKDSYVAEILLFTATFGWQWLEAHAVPQAATTTWRQLPLSSAPTYAFLWCVYFAKPLIRFLWLRWLWRYLIWSLFLIRLASMQLKIVPTYPDRHGGLGFIAVGHARFAALALTFGAQAASIMGEQIILEGKTLVSLRYEIVGVVAIVLLIFLIPLLAFASKLHDAKRIGLFEYGVLAGKYASAFHERWIRGPRGDDQLLGTSDIQSLADLGNSYQVVREMSISLIGKDNIMIFAVATLLPFVPLLLTVYPFDELIKHVLKVIM